MREVCKDDLSSLVTSVSNWSNFSEDNVAVPKSLLPDPGLDGNLEIYLSLPKTFKRSPEDLFAAWLVAVSQDALWKEELRLQILNICKKYKYEGKWMELFHYTRLDRLDLILYLSLESYRSKEEFYGNVQKRVQQITKRNLIRFELKRKPKPKKPQFRRGYNDKGSRRLSHEIHSCWKHSGPNEEKIDLSDSVTKRNTLLHFLYG